jgi:putative membrane protein
MTFLSLICVLFVAALQTYFMVLEMFYWTKPFGLRLFRHSKDYAEKSKALAQNQGLYNGFLAAGLLWGLIHPDPSVGVQIKVCFLLFVLIAGLYGAWTVSKKILVLQAVPALLTLALVLVSH